MDPKAQWERWTFWLPTAFSILGAVLGFLGYRGSQHAAELSRRTAEVALEPKLYVTSLSLVGAPLMPKSALVNYTVANHGATTLRNVKSYSSYKVLSVECPEQKAVQVSQSNTLSADLAAGDQADKSLLIAAFADGQCPAPDYRELISAKQGLLVEFNVTADSEQGRRIAFCESFFFDPHTNRFERNHDCKAVDWDFLFNRLTPRPGGR